MIEKNNEFILNSRLVKVENSPPFFLAGLDEVGRGPLAGPVVGCAVTVKHESNNWNSLMLAKLNSFFEKIIKEYSITDSKKLSSRKRQLFLESIQVEYKELVTNKKYSLFLPNSQGFQFEYCLQSRGPIEIDQSNILKCSLESMKLALIKLVPKNLSVFAVVDGQHAPDNQNNFCKFFPLIKGDQKFPLVSIASIIAKEYRDYYMQQMAFKYPQYELEKHKGYPTIRHKELIKLHGACEIHRRSFSGVL